MTNEPAYSFTIPSFGDDLPLDCRLYHPAELSTISSQGRLRGAVVAHPYAPLGGCYDDSVVLSVTDTLLEAGYVVATFNFRGAGDSAGRPSWTGHPEIEDNTSVAGLLVYYVHQLHTEASRNPETLEPIISTTHPAFEPDNPFAGPSPNEKPVHVLLAGYSFGSLILARLPPVAQIIERFETADKGTAAGEIFLRARMLAKQTQAAIERTRRPSTPRGRNISPSQTATSPKARASPVTVGGEETDPRQRRRSRGDSKHGTDIIRDVPNRIKTHIRRHSGSSAKHSIEQQQRPSTTSTIIRKGPTVVATYLLISPVLLPLTTMLLPPGLPTTFALPFGFGGSHAESGVFSWKSRTLLIFGAGDNFTSAKRLRQWAAKLQRQSPGFLQWAEVEGAGHFWRENGAMQSLSSNVISWDRNSPSANQR